MVPLSASGAHSGITYALTGLGGSASVTLLSIAHMGSLLGYIHSVPTAFLAFLPILVSPISWGVCSILGFTIGAIHLGHQSFLPEV